MAFCRAGRDSMGPPNPKRRPRTYAEPSKNLPVPHVVTLLLRGRCLDFLAALAAHIARGLALVIDLAAARHALAGIGATGRLGRGRRVGREE